MSLQERLSKFLKESSDWERRSTTVAGIFLLKIPSSKTGTRRESLAIEINPVNQMTGFPIKKRGVVIMSTAELEEITKILTNPKLLELTRVIDKTKKIDSDIIEL
jgi:RecB family endonuclease NucS